MKPLMLPNISLLPSVCLLQAQIQANLLDIPGGREVPE
jgi:hypothetical protein